MSRSSGRDGSTSHTPYVSPTSSSNTSLRNDPPAGSSALLNSTLIPRDYLASLSKSRLNSTDTVPHPSSPLSATSSSGVSSQATAKALQVAHDHSSDDEDYEDEAVIEEPDENPLQENLNLAKTRPNAATTIHTQPPQKSSSFTGSARAVPSPTNAPVLLGAMPRTSSIDSAISTISNSSHPSKSSSEGREPSATDIRGLIATAGSAENLVSHLLRDKSHAASQNAQLWKLVDKQRALLLGLNKDLERVTKERDRYRKKAKDLHALGLNESVGRHAAHSQTPPTSAGDEPRSQLPLGPAITSQTNGDWTVTAPEPRAVKMGRSPVEAGMMPSPLHLQQYQPHDVHVDDRSLDLEPASPTLGLDLPIQRMEDDAIKPAAPKLSALTTQLAPPAFSVTEATPLVESPARGSLTQRRAPPKPLNLAQTREEQTQSRADDAQKSVQESEAEAFERGRRKTRDDDDRDREIAVLQEQEARSRSKKEKRSKVDQTRGEELPLSPNESTQYPQTKRPYQVSGSPHLIASPPTTDLLHRTPSGTETRLLSPPLRSPGLPASPRPSDRPLASPLPTIMAQAQANAPSLPMSPRDAGFALSPRAPKQPLPQPTNLHSMDALSHNQPQSKSFPHSDSTADSGRPRVHEHTMSSSEIPTIYRGLVSPTWPDLLLPPNALPSIQVKVASSRLRPSRFSVLGFRPQEDTSVFSLSVFSRSNAGELWRVEKVPAALPHLDQQLRPRCPEVPRLPDRKLFSGHAPATIDARRDAVDAYFEDLLDTHIDEQSALIICKFLSMDVLEPQAEPKPRSDQTPQTQDELDVSGKIKKTGCLTKKGKNFGGWKSRYFVLESSELRYFEGQGGAHLGTIKLYNAKIGRQTAEDGLQDDGDTDSQFRHAFLILEPKRRNENRYVRHVLCAENDTERDDWVRALLHHVEESTAQDTRPTTAGGLSSESVNMTSSSRALLRGTDFADSLAGSTAKSSSPTLGPHNSGNDSPTSPSPATPDASSHDGYWSRSANGPSASSSSTPQRFQQRQPQPIPQPNREQKIRNLFQFRKSSHEQLSTSQGSDDRPRHEHSSQRNRGYVRPVFGLSLAEAVEVCPPQNVDVLLPAVVYRCIEYLRAKKASNEEGLFRLSGSNLVIRTLKERFNTEGDVDLLAEEEYYDVHAVASLFKTYLRELPSTILTRDLHIEFLRVLELDDRQQKILAFNSLVHQLPRVNFSLLRTLSQYLLEVVQNSDRNKMSVKNVGIVFSPTLNIPAPVFAMFLTDFDAIFSQYKPQDQPEQPPQPEQQEDRGVRRTMLAPLGSDLHPEVRSPRHQMYSHLPTTPAMNQNNHNQNSSVQPNYAPEQSRQHDPAADLGMAPMQPSYESRKYVSVPSHPAPPQPMYPPPQPHQPQHQHQTNNQPQPRQQQYRMFAPQDAANDKAKRRESAMHLF